MDEYLADLHACITFLGITDNKNFVKDVDTIVSLRDILRHLRRETEKCEIRIELGKFKVVEKCLISLLKLYHDDSILFDLVIRLLMNLTQPSFICFKQELPTDSVSMEVYIKVDEILQKCKPYFTDKIFLEVLSSKISDIYNKEWEDRSEEDHMMIERILILMRNILHINTSKSDGIIPAGIRSKHDELIMAMMESDWKDLLIYLSNTENEERFTFHTLEIISLIFREQSSEFMVTVKSTYSVESVIQRQLMREQEIDNMTKLFDNPRVRRYGGTFELRDIKTPSGRPTIYHHNITSGKIDLMQDRKIRRRAKNRLPNKEEIRNHKSSEDVLKVLQEFCGTFLQIGYNVLMKNALSSLQRHQMQADDETYYLWALRFFMEVCRLNKFNPEYVSETVNIEVFHWVHQQAIDYFNNGKIDNKTSISSYRKLHLAMSAYKELLEFCLSLDSHKEEKYRALSVSIKSRVFYNEEYIEIYPMLLINYKPIKQSRAYLRELIEGSYLIIKILQDHKDFGMKFVRKLKKKRTKRKSVKKLKEEHTIPIMPEDNENVLRPIWEEMLEKITSAVSGDIDLPINLPVIYDPLLPESRESIEPDSEPVDSQLKRALGLVQIRLRQNNPIEAVAIFQLSQKLWPEEERIMVSEDDDRIDEEIKILKDIMFASTFYKEEDIYKLSNLNEIAENSEDNEEDEEEESDDEEMDNVEVREVPFDFTRFMLKFCHPNVVNVYGTLFEDIITNPQSTNNRLLKIMHFIAEKLKKPFILYQLKLLNGFNKFLQDPISNIPEFKSLKKFVIYIIRKFTEHFNINRKLLLEILFSKSLHEAYETVYGYDNSDDTVHKEWTDELDAELVRLYKEVQLEDILPGFDKASVIETRFSDRNKTRRQILNRMVTLGLIKTAKELKNKKRNNNPWTGDEQARLIILVEESRDQPNPIKEIMNGLRATTTDPNNLRSKGTVVTKILELGLVENKEKLGIRSKNNKLNTKNDDSDSDEDHSETEYHEYIEIEDNDESKFMNEIFQKSLSSMKRNPPPPKINRNIDWTALKITYAQLNEKEKEWFVETLADNIDSRANGIVGSLAIVPLQEHESAILENKLVQKLLYICEFLYPDQNEGHLFWRIPEEMTAKELEYFKNCVTSLTDNELEDLAMEKNNEKSKYSEFSDSFRSKSKASFDEKRVGIFSDSEDIFSKDSTSILKSNKNEGMENFPIIKKIKKSKIQNLISDDEEEEEDISQQMVFNSNKSSKRILSDSVNMENTEDINSFKNLKKSIHLLMSDDEEESEKNTNYIENENYSNSSFEDRENIQKRNKRIIEDSDEEDEVISKRKKRVKIIADEDESD